MLRSVAVLVLDDVSLFELGVAAEVFGIDRSDDGVPNFDFRVCSPEAGVPVTVAAGGTYLAPYGLAGMSGVDVVIVPAVGGRDFPLAVLEALRRAHAAGAVVLSVCSGAFVLAAAGLLDGRRCTTHWRHTEELALYCPAADVDPDVLFVDAGSIITSAGTAAGIDACLHLVRRELGGAVVTTIARRMVVPPQRDGGQRQYVELPVPDCAAESLQPLLTWMLANLGEEQSVAGLARRAAMSERTFARRFVAETGTTPHKWLSMQRVLHARDLLEQTDLPVERVAARSGFGTAALLRHHFRRVVGVAPHDYRRNFSRSTDASAYLAG